MPFLLDVLHSVSQSHLQTEASDLWDIVYYLRVCSDTKSNQIIFTGYFGFNYM